MPASEIEVTIEDGQITITLPFNEKGTVSTSGKSNIHASTRGNQQVTVEDDQGQEYVLNVGVNVYTARK